MGNNQLRIDIMVLSIEKILNFGFSSFELKLELV